MYYLHAHAWERCLAIQAEDERQSAIAQLISQWIGTQWETTIFCRKIVGRIQEVIFAEEDSHHVTFSLFVVDNNKDITVKAYYERFDPVVFTLESIDEEKRITVLLTEEDDKAFYGYFLKDELELSLTVASFPKLGWKKRA